MDALSKVAEERLEEMLSLKQQLAQLEAALEEVKARPPSDEQLRAHPDFINLSATARKLSAQLQASDRPPNRTPSLPSRAKC